MRSGHHPGTEFVVTEEHLALLRRAVVSWEDCEYGAPSIDCKRPYGNSYVEGDIAEILGWDGGNGPDGPSDDLRDRARQIHLETQTVLQIALATGEFKPGRYVRDSLYTRGWRPKAADYEPREIARKALEDSE